MIIPMISKIRTDGREAIDPRSISYDDIMTCVNERERFRELNDLLNILEQIDGSDLENIGSKFLICVNNMNDAYLSAVAVYHALSQKTDRLSSFIFFDKNKDDRAEQGNMAIIMNPMMLTDQPDTVEDDDVCMIFVHENEGEANLSVDDIINNRLEFHIVRYDGNIPSYRRSFGFSRRICINSNEFIPAEECLENYFFTKDFEADNVRREMTELVRKLKRCDEYTMIAAAKQIISNHIMRDPYSRTLEPEDLENISLPSKNTVRKNQPLVGLQKEREKLNNIINSLYFEKMRRDMGYTSENDGCHIIFAGPPGTAKTTLAREFAERLADIGLISSRESFLECVKSDYIGQYVGQTAAKIDDMFREMAEKGGGVIFFDEIYTIAENDATAFDKEAMTCILQNMENHRQNIYCIFAGYEDEMARFVNGNPGLRSRISDTIRFEEYDDETLCLIFYSMLRSQNYKLSGDCQEILKEHFRKLRMVRGDHFGNGREVRNLIVNAKQQHVRKAAPDRRPTKKFLSSIDIDDIRKASEDIISSEMKNNSRFSIGF